LPERYVLPTRKSKFWLGSIDGDDQCVEDTLLCVQYRDAQFVKDQKLDELTMRPGFLFAAHTYPLCCPSTDMEMRYTENRISLVLNHIERCSSMKGDDWLDLVGNGGAVYGAG